MSKKRIKILALASFMLMGVMLSKTQDNRSDIQHAFAADYSNLNYTKGQAIPSGYTIVNKSSMVPTADSKGINILKGNSKSTFPNGSESKVKGVLKFNLTEPVNLSITMDKKSGGAVKITDITGKVYAEFAASASEETTVTNSIEISSPTDLYLGATAGSSNFYITNILFESLVILPKYNVSYFSTDGTTQYTELTEVVEEGSAPQINPILENEVGKTFLGWSATINGTEVIDPTAYTVTGELNFYAVWQEVTTHIVTFNDYEGATPRTVTMNEGPIVELKDPASREGFEFLGWYTTPTFDEGTQVTAETLLSADLTLYGKWQTAAYVFVTFEGIQDPYRTIQGHALDSWPTDPVEAGKVFVGWVDANGNLYTSSSTFSEDISLFAKWTVVLKEAYAFDDYGTLPPEKAEDFALVSNDVIEIKTYGYNKGNLDAPITYEGKLYTNYAQAKGLDIKLTKNATIAIICSQTNSSSSRKVMVKDVEGRVYNLNKIPVAKKTAGAITINLLAGEYTILTTEGSFNFYGINVDYTNSETLTSELIGLKSSKLNNQAGYDANHNESMRFVGEIDYTVVSEISSIYLSVSSTKLVDGVETNGSVFEGNIYTVYDRVTLTEGAKYGVVENRLYFYHIVDGLDETYKTVTCKASIYLVDGTVYNLNSVFDYKVSFGK